MRGGTMWRCEARSDQRTHESRGENRTQPSAPVSLPPRATMRVLLIICLPAVLLAQAQYQFPFLEDYGVDYFPDPDSDNQESLPGTYQQQVKLEPVVRPEKSEPEFETEPTEPGPLDCREEQYPCTRLYSVHKPCKQCLNSLCFYSLRRVYVINKEVCVRTVCAHEELLRADLCRDQFSRCGVAALSGGCSSLGGSCGKSCGSC
ncbi:microfibrillar-associated protein 2 [Antennarius striatus]|uniref:microfibrillar-associated protein 2 n=1 Tax=Antennarius striatus TaxID=241820 RepID=UPI0035B3EDCA